MGDPVTRQLGERMRVLGIDPGLTRCGLGVVDGVPGRQPLLVAVDVVRTSSDLDVARRLVVIEEDWIEQARIKEALLQYCARDTMAMVRLRRALKEKATASL